MRALIGLVGRLPDKVSARLEEIDFDETFDTGFKALERAKAWAKARLGEVLFEHDGKTLTGEEFSKIVEG